MALMPFNRDWHIMFQPCNICQDIFLLSSLVLSFTYCMPELSVHGCILTNLMIWSFLAPTRVCWNDFDGVTGKGNFYNVWRHVRTAKPSLP